MDGDKHSWVQFNGECFSPDHLDLSCLQDCIDRSRNTSETLHQARYHKSMHIALPDDSTRIDLT